LISQVRLKEACERGGREGGREGGKKEKGDE